MGAPLVALLLLGGAGTRLWPLSTEERPKQFLRLFGDRSLFQMTVERARAAGCDIAIIANAAQVDRIDRDLAEINVEAASILLEPARRDSGPALAAGVADVARRWGSDAVVAALPADHLIRDHAAFGASLAEAATVAAAGHIVTFGIRPTFAATGYGYIQRGPALAAGKGAARVERFHEKPDAATAAMYLADPRFAWNSGMFIVTAETFAREAEAHMPDIRAGAGAAVRGGRAEGRLLHLDAAAFSAVRRVSIDYALIEKSRNVATLDAAFDWSDIGTWDSVHAALPKDGDGNVIIGGAKVRDCRGCLVLSDGRPLAVAGLTDTVVVATQEGTFSAPRARAAIVKELVGA